MQKRGILQVVLNFWTPWAHQRLDMDWQTQWPLSFSLKPTAPRRNYCQIRWDK